MCTNSANMGETHRLGVNGTFQKLTYPLEWVIILLGLLVLLGEAGQEVLPPVVLVAVGHYLPQGMRPRGVLTTKHEL